MGDFFSIIDKSGDFAFQAGYGIIEPFDKYGIARVGFLHDDEYYVGLINDKGEHILEPDSLANFVPNPRIHIGSFNSHGLALINKDHYGYSFDYINLNGELMSDLISYLPQTSIASTADGNRYDEEGWVKISTASYTMGYVDSSGSIVLEPEYHSLGAFASNGLAYAQDGPWDKYGYWSSGQSKQNISEYSCKIQGQ